MASEGRGADLASDYRAFLTPLPPGEGLGVRILFSSVALAVVSRPLVVTPSIPSPQKPISGHILSFLRACVMMGPTVALDGASASVGTSRHAGISRVDPTRAVFALGCGSG